MTQILYANTAAGHIYSETLFCASITARFAMSAKRVGLQKFPMRINRSDLSSTPNSAVNF